MCNAHKEKWERTKTEEIEQQNQESIKTLGKLFENIINEQRETNSKK